MSGASQTGFDFGLPGTQCQRKEPWMPADARRDAHARPKGKATQCDRILALLDSRAGEWVPIYEIMDLRPRIAQYVTRIYELRIRGIEEGFQIDNKTERDEATGEIRSWYRLRLQQ